MEVTDTPPGGIVLRPPHAPPRDPVWLRDPPTIIAVDDEPFFVSMLARTFGRVGCPVRGFTTGAELFKPGVLTGHSIVLLDIRLGDESGIDICAKLRRTGYDGGIIMVTGKSDPDSMEIAYRAGADGYLAKPFAPKVLLAQVEAVLRRLPRFGEPLLEVVGRSVRVQGKEVRLTRTERAIVLALAAAGGTVVPKESLFKFLHGENKGRAMDTHISRIRAKLGAAASRLNTETLEGYRLVL